MRESFNVNHPELREDEIFIGNADEEEFREIKFVRKRLGEQAYNRDGAIIPKESGVRPVFVNKKEFYNFGGY